MHRSIKTTLMITTICAAIAGVGPYGSPAHLSINEASAQQPADAPADTSPESAETSEPAPAKSAPAKSAPVVRGGLPDVAAVFEQEKGKVVAVKTEMAQSVSNPFWGQRTVPRMGQGSGFVVESDGHIITNYHVVAGAQKIEVLLEEGGKRYKARLIGADKKTDIALLKIEAPANRSHHAWLLRRIARRRVGDRHRQPLRARVLGHRGDRERQGAKPRARALR